MELALGCDLRIAAGKAQFGALNRQWGVTLIDRGTQRLPRIVGYGNAPWMINTGRRVDAQTGAADAAGAGARPAWPGAQTGALAAVGPATGGLSLR